MSLVAKPDNLCSIPGVVSGGQSHKLCAASLAAAAVVCGGVRWRWRVHTLVTSASPTYK